MATTIADRRVTELQEALRVALHARDSVRRLTAELATVAAVLDQACEAIYNATYFDPAGDVADDAVTA